MRLGSFQRVCILLLLSALATGCRGHDPDTLLAQAGAPHANGFKVQVLDNQGFAVGYAPARRCAVWVVYQAREVDWRDHFERPRYHSDPRVPHPVRWYAYQGSGYDRGHLAPNYIISRLYGRKAQKQTFLMTNIVPQRPRLNQLVWQRLEEIEADKLAPALEALRVTTGPVFSENPQRIEDGPAIPVAFYRLWLDRLPGGGLRALALLVPQTVRGDERLDRFIVSVDQVEARTGLNFYPGLPDAMEHRIESSPARPRAWGFARHACMPARYAEDWRGRGGIKLRFDRCDN